MPESFTTQNGSVDWPAWFILSNCVYRFVQLIHLAGTQCVFAGNPDKCYDRYFSLEKKIEAICLILFIFTVENGKIRGLMLNFPNEIWSWIISRCTKDEKKEKNVSFYNQIYFSFRFFLKVFWSKSNVCSLFVYIEITHTDDMQTPA